MTIQVLQTLHTIRAPTLWSSAYLSLIITMNILHPTSDHLLQVTWWHWHPSKWFLFQRAQPPHLAVGKSWQQSCQPRLAKRIRTLGKWSSKLWPMKRLMINVHSALMNINKQSSTCWNITIVHTHWSQVICTQPLLVSESGLWNKCIITAWNMIYRRFGHTFGKTGTAQVDGTCGLIPAIQRSPYSKLPWYWKASKVL